MQVMRKLETGTIKTLCYIGDLPDRRIDGITTSFNRNLSILSDNFKIINTPENSFLKTGTIKKIITVLSFWNNTRRFINDKNPEVCYINLPTSFWGLFKQFVLLILIQNKSLVVVFHVHRGDFLERIESSWVYKLLANRIIKRVEKVIVLSPMEGAKLNETFKTKAFDSLTNTIDAPNVNSKIDRAGFLYVSNYLESKGIFDLLEVFTDLKEEGVRLECYGNFPNNEYKERLFKYASPFISINGPVVGAAKYKVLQKAKCLILPSRSEGQPLVILEAMSQGLPVIATDVGFVKELLGEDNGYYIPANNKEALKKVILKVAKNREMSIHGDCLQKRYKEKFNPSAHKKQLFEIFKPFMS